jgi:hypothetical protein
MVQRKQGAGTHDVSLLGENHVTGRQVDQSAKIASRQLVADENRSTADTGVHPSRSQAGYVLLAEGGTFHERTTDTWVSLSFRSFR